jgi:hypothetical protein
VHYDLARPIFGTAKTGGKHTMRRSPCQVGDEGLSKLLDRTRQLHNAVARLTSETIPATDARFVVSFQSTILSIEHAVGAYLLLTQTLHASGFSLYRLQFETLVRGIWLLHAANDNWVNRLSQPLTIESADRANQTPMLKEMLGQLDRSDAPDHLVQTLKQYRDVTWKALNSFAHGGLHPIARTIEGYPPELAHDAVRNSNGLITIAAQLIAIVSNEGPDMDPVRQLHLEFADCIPVI